jgi:hypothetical protein
MAAADKKSPNNWTIYSPKDGRVLLESDGVKASDTIYSPNGKVLSKREGERR